MRNRYFQTPSHDAIILFALISLNVLVHYIWFTDPNYFTHGDSGVYLEETQKELLRNALSVYNSNSDFGFISYSGGYNLILFIFGVLASAGINYAFSLKILILYPYVIITPVISYLLLNQILNSRPAAIIGSLILLFNTYSLMLQAGHLLILLGNTLALLFLYQFNKVFRRDSSHVDFIVLTFIGLILSSYEFRIFYLIVGVCSLLLLYDIFILKGERLLLKLLSWVTLIILVLLLNSYWILPILSTNKLLTNELFSRGLFGSSFFDILSSLTLFHKFWTGREPSVFINQPVPPYLFILPFLSILGLWLNRKNKTILFFGLLLLLGIILSKQSSPPFEDLYLWLYNHVPGFNAFREASKFYFIVAIAYAVLIGAFVKWISEYWVKTDTQRFVKNVSLGLIAFIFMWNTKPLLTGEMETLFVPRHIPNDYQIAKDFILKQPDYFRTLWVPTTSRWSIYTNQHPKVSAADAVFTAWDVLDDYKGLEGPTPHMDKLITDMFDQPLSQNLIDMLSIKYVLVPVQDVKNDDNFFKDYGERRLFLKKLDETSYLSRINIGTKEIVLYENKGYHPHVYLTEKMETLDMSIPRMNVEYQIKSPTEYKVTLRKINKPVFLNFTERYLPDWKIRAGNMHWIDALRTGHYFISDRYHLKNEAMLNSFLIDPEYVKNAFAQSISKRYQDGSIDIDLTIYFKPQLYGCLGLMISGLTLILITIYFTAVQIERRRNLAN